MKNYFKEGQCSNGEQDVIANLQWCIDNRIRSPEHETTGWLFNLVKNIESKAGRSGSSDDQELRKRIDEIDVKIADFLKFVEDLPPKITASFDALGDDITKLADEVQKQKSGMLYLKKELDAVKSKLPSDVPNPPVAPVPEPQPAEPKPEPKPKPAPSEPVKAFKKK